MVQARRAAWNALSPEEQELSDEQHDHGNHRRRTHLAVYEEHPSVGHR
jgi:hypothetical protein